MDPQSLYVQLGNLISEMPNLQEQPIPLSTLQWLGKAHALVSETHNIFDAEKISRAMDGLSRGGSYVITMLSIIPPILYRALAKAEIAAPASAQGAFIPAGSVFDAIIAVGKILAEVTSDVLIVDPYMDEKVLTDFLTGAPENVSIRLLADQTHHKMTLKPAVTRWISQYKTSRPLQAKLAPERTLHDRIIMVDRTVSWTLTQSFNGFATKSPATIARNNPEIATLKIAAYEEMWSTASEL